jgi:hypothetical protein
MAASEALIERCGLNYSFICKLFMRWSYDTESWRSLPSRCSWCFHSSRSCHLTFFRTFHWRISWLCGLLQPRLDNMSLLFSNRNATLQLLPHCWILRHKPWRKTRESNVLNSQPTAFPRRQWSVLRGGILRTRIISRKVEFAGSVSRCRKIRGSGFFLDYDLWRNTIS